MITAEFYLRDAVLIGFSVKGHAGFADYGKDVCCAAVTSAVQLTANAVTEILKADAKVDVFENEIRLMLGKNADSNAINFLKALKLHLKLLSEDYSENIRLIDMEV